MGFTTPVVPFATVGVQIDGLPLTYVATWPKLFRTGKSPACPKLAISVEIVVVVPLAPCGTVGVHNVVGATAIEGQQIIVPNTTCPRSFTAAATEDKGTGLLVLKSVSVPAVELATTGLHRNAWLELCPAT